MKIKLLFWLFLIVFLGITTSAAKPAISEIDRIRLAEAFRISAQIGDKVWRNWSATPFAVLLVTPNEEFLIRHPKPSKDFISLGYDRVLRSEIYYRPRVFKPNLLATFPAVGGISTAVIGQAENTDKNNSTAWVITLLHEHFHQLQTSQPDYYPAVGALNLSKGDQSGMWMLNYDFPYQDEKVGRIFQEMARKLAGIVSTEKIQKKYRNREIEDYLALRDKLKSTLSASDYDYFSFQIWQEGFARYTEYKIARFAARNYEPTKEFKRLKDFRSFKSAEDELRQEILRELSSLSLPNWKRVAFYPLGAAEALLLDELNPEWRKRYFAEKFYAEKYFEKRR